MDGSELPPPVPALLQSQSHLADLTEAYDQLAALVPGKSAQGATLRSDKDKRWPRSSRASVASSGCPGAAAILDRHGTAPARVFRRRGRGTALLGRAADRLHIGQPSRVSQQMPRPEREPGGRTRSTARHATSGSPQQGRACCRKCARCWRQPPVAQVAVASTPAVRTGKLRTARAQPRRATGAGTGRLRGPGTRRDPRTGRGDRRMSASLGWPTARLTRPSSGSRCGRATAACGPSCCGVRRSSSRMGPRPAPDSGGDVCRLRRTLRGAAAAMPDCAPQQLRRLVDLVEPRCPDRFGREPVSAPSPTSPPDLHGRHRCGTARAGLLVGAS